MRFPQQHLRSRAPLRLGLAGGGTDLPQYSDVFGGAVLNATISRYAYAHLRFRTDRVVRLSAIDIGRTEEHEAHSSLPLDHGLLLHRQVYNRIVEDFLDGDAPGIDLSTTVDAPPGSGLGSSSALVVALVEVFRHAFDLPLGPYEVASLAFDIERKDLGLAGGKQDQYAAAFGGMNFMEFLPDGRVIVNPLRLNNSALKELEASLVVCFTGQSRRSETIIESQISGIRVQSHSTIGGLHQLKNEAYEMKSALLRGDMRAMADVLERSWRAKRATAPDVSNAEIDNLYGTALANGAWSGKISGAGGGGFMMLMTDPERRYGLIKAINEAGGQASPIHLTSTGAETWTVNG